MRTATGSGPDSGGIMGTVTVCRRDFLVGGAASVLAMGSLSVRAKANGNETVTRFSFRASDAALKELTHRLDQTRWPERETATGWEQGPPLATMRTIVDYWRSGYDWRKCEAELSQWPQFKTRLDGLDVHFIHVRSAHQNALPLILTHGWPSTILLFRHVIRPLTEPTAHGGTEADAFDVVIPSLPGFAFSGKPAERGWNAERIARAWGMLMQRLGYGRFVAQGGDWGAFVTTAMAQQHVPGLAAIHLNFAQTIPDRIPSQLKSDQKRA